LIPLNVAGSQARPLLDVAAAGPGELGIVISILAEASAALVERGINQWPSPPSPALRHLIEEQIALGQVYLARLPETGELAGTVRLTWRHVAVWPEDPDSAGYVHTLAIRPTLRGRQLGVALLAWAASHLRARQRRFLRLDCMAGSQPLRSYYERLGFVGRGLAAVDGYELARYELDLQVAGSE
jgi:ribosomal protein S18 acetylase RimI-like enzyme